MLAGSGIGIKKQFLYNQGLSPFGLEAKKDNFEGISLAGMRE
jgi:hypothetical protein